MADARLIEPWRPNSALGIESTRERTPMTPFPAMDDRLHARIESVRIRGFRSLADAAVTDLPPVAVLIGANGSGKSNVMRFFEMLGWMLRSSRLGDFVQMARCGSSRW